VRDRVRALLPRLHVLPALSGDLDQWADWLIRTRYAGWAEEEIATAVAALEQRRDRVLDAASIRPGETLVDVGAGTGLLTIGAVDRVGAEGDVIALDISVDTLEHLRAHATAPNVAYLIGSAEVLPLMDASVDVVVTRSVLIYVEDKAAAAREFFRVLRASGRVSIFEPVNSRNLLLTDAVDFSPLGDLGARVRDWNTAFYANPDDPMLDFDETDLSRFFEEAGFVKVELELGAQEDEIAGSRYLNQVGAPGRPTLVERWRQAFVPDDVERLQAFVEELSIPVRFPYAFLAARKP
jgi:arsenite methyltransferase